MNEKSVIFIVLCILFVSQLFGISPENNKGIISSAEQLNEESSVATIGSTVSGSYKESHKLSSDSDPNNSLFLESPHSTESSLSGQIELYYDDGVAEAGFAPTLSLYTYAVRFHIPTSEPYQITEVKYYIHSSPSSFKLDIRDASIQSLYSETVTPTTSGWFIVDLTSQEIIVDGDFWVGLKYLTLHAPELGADTSDPDVESGESSSGFPSSPNISSLDWMIRAIVELAEPPISEWRKPYGGTENDRAWSVVQTVDGGYLVVGDTLSYGAGSDDIWVVKTDSDGNVQAGWPKTYGGSNYDRGRSVARTFDGGYIIAGYTNSYGVGIDDFWLVKIDAFGNKQWDETFGGTGVDRAYSVLQRVDGGYVVAGYTKSYGAGQEDFMLVKITADGQESWSWYGGPNSDMARCVVQTTDGGFAIAGYTNSFGAGSYDFYFIKTNENGGLQWSRTYGGSGTDMAYSVVQTADGGYLLAGDTTSWGAGSFDFCLYKIDSNGDVEDGWPKMFGGSGADTVWSMIQTYDGGYLIVGDTTSSGAGQEDFWLVKTDSSGNYQWDKTYGGSGADMASFVRQTSDGGYIISGRTNSYGMGGDDFWLIKLSNESITADLNILRKSQRKDTLMLCLEGSPYTGTHAWDVIHRGDWPHECLLCNKYCARAAISMANSYYGGYLSQDRISFYVIHERNSNPVPEGDLGYGRGLYDDEISDAISWSLNGATIDIREGKPDFGEIKNWINSGRPILCRIPGAPWHIVVVDGYEQASQIVHVIDPWNGTEGIRELYSTLDVRNAWILPALAGITARSDEDWNSNGTPDTIEDYDNDGVCDFDEMYRFLTDPDNLDSDGDGVPDKAEIISYTFLNNLSFDASDSREPDPDDDGLRAELDNDSDDGGVHDGLEDKNGNGLVDSGETDPLDPSDDPNIVHLESKQDNDASSNLGLIIFDSLSYPLPDDIEKTAATYSIEYIAPPDYIFDCWETSDGVTVTDPNARSTSAKVTGDGTLRAIYKEVQTAETTVEIEGQSYTITLESSATMTDLNATRNTLHFTSSGTSGEIAYINATFPIELNQTEIMVFIDDESIQPPFPVIKTNGTHYAIYFNFTLSTHEIQIRYAVSDIAITNMTLFKAIVGEGFSTRINITLQNQGSYQETFNITVYANTSSIALETVILSSGNFIIIPVEWNTIGFVKGNYTITAMADIVLGEIDISDNNFTSWIFVTIPGDVDGDFDVDIFDIVLIAGCYGSSEGDPEYIANCDIDGDGDVDIYDIVAAAGNYGENWLLSSAHALRSKVQETICFATTSHSLKHAPKYMLSSQLSNDSRGMKPSANSIQHLRLSKLRFKLSP